MSKHLVSAMSNLSFILTDGESCLQHFNIQRDIQNVSLQMQYDIASIVVLFVSLGFVCTRPSQHLHSVQPPPRLTCITEL